MSDAENHHHHDEARVPAEWVDAHPVIQRTLHRHSESIRDLRARDSMLGKLIGGLDADVRAVRADVTALREALFENNRLSRNEANAAAVERRLNGQIYHRLEERLDHDLKLRSAYYANDELRSDLENGRLKWAKGIFWAVVALIFSLLFLVPIVWKFFGFK